MRAAIILTLCGALGVVFGAGCSDPDPSAQPAEVPVLPMELTSAEVDLIVPGTAARVEGSGFFSDAIYTGTVSGQTDGRGVDFPVQVSYIDDLTLHVLFDADAVEAAGEGQLQAVLRVEARLREAVGQASIALEAEVSSGLTPQVSLTASAVYPASPFVIRGSGFLNADEGVTVAALRGEFTPDGGFAQPVDLQDIAAEAIDPANWDRDAVQFIFDPAWVGIAPGRFEGTLVLANLASTGGRTQGEAVDVRFDLLQPFIEDVSPRAASRGQAIVIRGQGFVGGEYGGLTSFRLEGTLATPQGLMVPTPPGGIEISPTWRSGTELIFSLRPTDFDRNTCRSDEFGGFPGVLDGTVTPLITYGDQQIDGTPSPLVFEVLPTRQVVHLKFLPAFTDSLRLFGLRNVSGPVKDRVFEVIRRDYAGFNLVVQAQSPTDFLEYSTVEIGGPDPNAQGLFGLDNTTGLDTCNTRLDDNLAGQNADSNGAFGGVFVESFRQLSPRIGDNPLASVIFDEIFDPVVDQPVSSDEFPGGGRDAVIERAIRTLGNLIGNTITHEIGHSLGLTRVIGCGQYHNPPGPRQIMDCGADRPFEERAEVEPDSHGMWLQGNRTYLEQVLPLE